MRKLVLTILALFALSLVAAACGTETVVKEVEVEKIVTQEVIKEVPVEVIVTQEVVREVQVPGQTVVVEKEVIWDVKVPGETVVVTKEVIKEVPVEVVVMQEVVKEVKVPGETVVVTKEVEVIKEVFIEIAPVIQRIGKHLIGKIEGPTVISDKSKFPTARAEAPMLAKLVAAGKLPPVGERLPEVPLVYQPLDEIGKYGGTWRRGFTGPADRWNFYRCCAGDTLMYTDYLGTSIIPNVAESVEVLDDSKTFRFHLRKGMKWSDGAPFTTNDFMFWWDHWWNNDEITPTKHVVMDAPGTTESGTVTKIDDYTIEFKFAASYGTFLDFTAQAGALNGHAFNGRNWGGGWGPEHYLQQYHPDFVGGKEAAEKIAAAEGFDNWVNLIKSQNDATANEDLPVTTIWKTVVPMTKPTFVVERNPYYFAIDTAGNQLPYIDRVVMSLAEDLQVLNLRAVAGEYDFQARHITVGTLPVFLQNADKRNYTMQVDPMQVGSDHGLWFNQDYQEDPEIGKWLRNRDFRRAIGLAIDRDELNETFFLGIGVPGSMAPSADNKYHPGAEWLSKWATLDPATANKMLDDIGLSAKDKDGFRLRTDGSGKRLSFIVSTMGAAFVEHTLIMETVKEQLADNVGIAITIKEMERSLLGTYAGANKSQIHSWGNDGSDVLFFGGWFLPGGWVSPRYGTWFQSGGEAGTAPSEKMQEMYWLIRKGHTVGDAERIEIGKAAWKIFLDEAIAVGTVGQAGAVMGIRVTNNNMGNTPERQTNLNLFKPPMISSPQTYYFK
jgi:peptide/nickel transport system substrate-binding protein